MSSESENERLYRIAEALSKKSLKLDEREQLLDMRERALSSSSSSSSSFSKEDIKDANIRKRHFRIPDGYATRQGFKRHEKIIEHEIPSSVEIVNGLNLDHSYWCTGLLWDLDMLFYLICNGSVSASEQLNRLVTIMSNLEAQMRITTDKHLTSQGSIRLTSSVVVPSRDDKYVRLARDMKRDDVDVIVGFDRKEMEELRNEVNKKLYYP
jgi:hypothetical protein